MGQPVQVLLRDDLILRRRRGIGKRFLFLPQNSPVLPSEGVVRGVLCRGDNVIHQLVLLHPPQQGQLFNQLFHYRLEQVLRFVRIADDLSYFGIDQAAVLEI